MCGIVGVVLRDRAPVDPAVLRAMADTIAHRGPDGSGVFAEPGVGFGHRRLSILDLTAAAAQPMSTPRGDTVLTFNGEIYDYATLRARLEALGDTFRSTGDTEVLLHALARWRTEALQHVHGMFAFGAWFASDRTLLLARDRFGKKPLYVAHLGRDGRDGLAFASEMRALLAHPQVRAEASIDPAAVAQYLAHDYVPAPRSILANVTKVAAGEWLTWRDGHGVQRGRYYTPPFGRRETGSVEQLTQRFTSLVDEAVRTRLVSDVPVGVFLSGGVDSSLVAALAVRHHPHVRTFAIGFDDPSFDESSHARAVAAHLGTVHTEERLSAQSMLDLLPATLDSLDEPFADGSLLPTTLLARVARRNVTVALGGDGGDEPFAGYPTFVADRIARFLPAFPAGITRLAGRMADAIPASDGNFSLAFKVQHFAQGLDATGAARHARWLAPFATDALARVAGPKLGADARALAFAPAIEAARGTTNAFDAAVAFYLRVYLADGVLMKVDRATMQSSLEARAPLLDTRVIEFALGVPHGLRLRGNVTKYLMRRALAPLVPASIVERPKKGFGAPIGRWLRGPLRPLLEDTLARDTVTRGGWFDPDAVDALVKAHVTGRADLRKPLWALLVFEHWRRTWLG